jgi:hypothetical protein
MSDPDAGREPSEPEEKPPAGIPPRTQRHLALAVALGIALYLIYRCVPS